MQTTILIIDDSEDDILLTTLVLKKIAKDIRIASAQSGEKGLALLRGAGALPTLVLLDLKMPGMDGFDVLRQIRRDSRLHGLPVIIVTHSDLETDKIASRRNGANSFLNKSVDLGQFEQGMRAELAPWL